MADPQRPAGTKVHPLYLPSDPPEIARRLWQGWTGYTAFYVGANMGQNLAELASRFHRIFCFEPNPLSWDVLATVVARFDGPTLSGIRPQIDMMKLAVSDHDGTLDLASLPGTRQETTGQYVTFGHKGMEWEPRSWGNRDEVVPVRVPCKTLDTLSEALGDPDFITIDTEGHEALILAGADKLLSTTKPGFLIEFHSSDNFDTCRRLLGDAGYRVDAVRHPHYPPHTRMWYQHGWLRARPAPPIPEEKN